MKCKILHELPGRMRVHAVQPRMTLSQADILEAYLRAVDGVTEAKVYDRTCDAVIVYTAPRADIVAALAAFSYEAAAHLADAHSSRALDREYEEKLVNSVIRRCVNKLLLPVPLRTAMLPPPRCMPSAANMHTNSTTSSAASTAAALFRFAFISFLLFCCLDVCGIATLDIIITSAARLCKGPRGKFIRKMPSCAHTRQKSKAPTRRWGL